jgi:hypothetical protein
MTTSTLGQVATLPNKSLPELQQIWKELYQDDPPPYSKTFLAKRLAFRIQELAFGGLSEATEKRLKALSKENGGRIPTISTNKPIVGTKLIREFKGIEHSCTVTETGFEYQGRPYKSLSAVARAITGTRWNGLVFWGLKRVGQSK